MFTKVASPTMDSLHGTVSGRLQIHTAAFTVCSLKLTRGSWMVRHTSSCGGRYDHYVNEDGHFSPRAGLIYLSTETTSLKLLYSHANRAASAIERLGTGTTSIQNLEIEPEKINTLDFIVMNKSAQSSSTWTTFMNNRDNKIELVAGAAGRSGYQNIGQAESYGTELEGKYFFLNGNLGTTARASYVRSADTTSTR